MSTRNHSASVKELDEAFGCSGSLLASKKIAAAEEVFDLICEHGQSLARTGRCDRLQTAVRRRMAIIAAVARNRPAAEFEAWLDRYFASRWRGPRRRT